MKKLAIIIGIISLMSVINSVHAQSVNVNMDKQPAWGPVGYDYAGYYYFPDLNIYFDVNSSLFYYSNSGKWISNKYLPDKYRKYDLYSLYKIVINDSQPWNQNKTHKKTYSTYKGDRTQTSIRYSNDTRYSTSKGNSNVWVNTSRDSNNRGTSNTRSSNTSDRGNTQSDRNSGRQSSSSRK